MRIPCIMFYKSRSHKAFKAVKSSHFMLLNMSTSRSTVKNGGKGRQTCSAKASAALMQPHPTSETPRHPNCFQPSLVLETISLDQDGHSHLTTSPKFDSTNELDAALSEIHQPQLFDYPSASIGSHVSTSTFPSSASIPPA